jgi:hypothetical protein
LQHLGQAAAPRSSNLNVSLSWRNPAHGPHCRFRVDRYFRILANVDPHITPERFEIMRLFILSLTLAATGLLSACDDDATCTQEQATAKATEVMTSLQTLATSDPEKLAALTPRLTEIQGTLTAEGADLAAACKALDDIAAEIAAAPAQ